MEQLEFFSIPSPCVGICQANERGYCKGCMRSREERFNWQNMTADEQRNTIRLCRQRYLRLRRKNKAAQEPPAETGMGEGSQQLLFEESIETDR